MAESTTKSYLPAGLAVPVPSPDGMDKDFYEGLKRHELTVQRCNKCHTFQFAPELICHKCQSPDLGWQKVSGRGRLYSWIRIWNPVHPALKTACPYIVAVVELPDAGGVRMVGNLSGIRCRTCHSTPRSRRCSRIIPIRDPCWFNGARSGVDSAPLTVD